MSPRHMLPSPPRASPWHPPGTPFPAALLCSVLHDCSLDRASWPCPAPQAVSVGTCCRQETGCPWGRHSPSRIGQALRPVRACALEPHSSVLASFISSLSLGPPQSPCPGTKLMFREGGPWGERVAGAPNLSSADSCSWDPVTALTSGHRALLAIRPRPGSEAASICLSSSSCRLPWPSSPFLNLGVPPQGTARLAGPKGRLPQCLGDPPPWDTCSPGSPRSQGAPANLPGREPDGTPRPPPTPGSPAPARARSGPRAGRSRGCLRVFGRGSVRPAQGGRQERGPARPARLGSSPRAAGEGRCGRPPWLSNHCACSF